MKSQNKVKGLLLILSAALVVAIAAPPSPAPPQPQVRMFSAAISPTTVNAGATDLYTITITNDAASTHDPLTAKVVIPTGFASISIITPNPTTSDGEPWTAAIDGTGTEILLGGVDGNDRLHAGQSVSVSFNATAPAVVGDYEWTTSAYQADDWTATPFTLTGSQPTVEVIAVNFFFDGWRPPVINHQGDPDWGGWESGSTMPVKFLVVDDEGAPVTEGVVAMVQIGGSDPVLAVLDDPAIGQWKAEVVLDGSGEQDVTITGNVEGVTPLSIFVKVNP